MGCDEFLQSFIESVKNPNVHLKWTVTNQSSRHCLFTLTAELFYIFVVLHHFGNMVDSCMHIAFYLLFPITGSFLTKSCECLNPFFYFKIAMWIEIRNYDTCIWV